MLQEHAAPMHTWILLEHRLARKEKDKLGYTVGVGASCSKFIAQRYGASSDMTVCLLVPSYCPESDL